MSLLRQCARRDARCARGTPARSRGPLRRGPSGCPASPGPCVRGGSHRRAIGGIRAPTAAQRDEGLRDVGIRDAQLATHQRDDLGRESASDDGLPSRSARASRGSVGIRARTRPSAVARPSSSIAPSPRSTAIASARFSAGSGRSSAVRCRPGHPSRREAARVREVDHRDLGHGTGGRRRVGAFVDAADDRAGGPDGLPRPARCTHDERDAAVVTRPVMPRPASRCGCRDRQLSTTRRTPGTVSEDSASDVVTMMRGRSAGARPRITASCSAGGIWPCSSRTSKASLAARTRRAISDTSRAPWREDQHVRLRVFAHQVPGPGLP